MARESQGLQIALIIFVMLTIVLIVTTFLYHSRYTDALKQAKDNEQLAAQERRKTGEKEIENADLRRIIGLAEKSGVEIREQFDKDMKAYGSNFPDEARFYSPILKRLWDTGRRAPRNWPTRNRSSRTWTTNSNNGRRPRTRRSSSSQTRSPRRGPT